MKRKNKICIINRAEFEKDAQNYDSMTSLVMDYANIIKNKLNTKYGNNTISYIGELYLELKVLYKNDYTRIIKLKNSIITSGAIISYLKVTIHSHYGADITKAIAKSIK